MHLVASHPVRTRLESPNGFGQRRYPCGAPRVIQFTLSHEDLVSLEGMTIGSAEIRDGALRLHTTAGYIVAISIQDDGLDIADETDIP